MDDEVAITPASLAEFKRDLESMKSQLVAKLSTDSMKRHLEALKLTSVHLPDLKFMPDSTRTLDAICSYGTLPAEIYVCVISIVIAMLTNEKDRSPRTCTGIVLRMVKYLVNRAPNHVDVGYILFLFRHMVCSSRKKQYRPVRASSSRWTNLSVENGNNSSNSNSGKRNNFTNHSPVNSNAEKRTNSNGSFGDESNANSLSDDINDEEQGSSYSASRQGMVTYYDAHKMAPVFKDWPLIEGRIRAFMVRSMDPAEIRRLAVEQFKVAVPLTDEDFLALGAIPSPSTQLLAQAMKTLTVSKHVPSVNRPTTSSKSDARSIKPSLVRVDWEKLFNKGGRLEFKVPFSLIPLDSDDTKSSQDSPCRIFHDGWAFVSADELTEVLEALFVAEIEADLFDMCDRLSAFPFFHYQVLPPKFYGVLFTWPEDMKMYKNLYVLLQREELFVLNQAPRFHSSNRGSLNLSSVLRHINELPLCLKLLIERLRSDNQTYKLGHYERMDLIRILRAVGVSREEAIVLFKSNYHGTENMDVTIRDIYSPTKKIIPSACENLAGKGMCPFASGSKANPLIQRDIEDSMKELSIGFTRQPETPASDTKHGRVLDFKDWDAARLPVSASQEPKGQVQSPERTNPFLFPSSTALEKCRMVTELKIRPFAVTPSLVYKSPVGAMNLLMSTLLESSKR